ncbi:right-handed parallel beta-helix repeat-containing protein, partial [bacterium]|nr:right-handed parallel beta-helix repeat-containing protein [bacterium]
GNGQSGVRIDGPGTRENLVWKNHIGTDMNGTAAIGNDTYGILIEDSARANNISGNLVSGNAYGIVIRGTGSDSNFVHKNWVGLDASGLAALPNTAHGIRIENGARYNLVGSSSYDEANVVSGNGWSGLCTVGDSTAFNTFNFNYAGTDTSGLKAVGNVYYGAHFGGRNNWYWKNVLSGNRCGMVISGYSQNTELIGNLIGTGRDGETPVPNAEAGIRIQDDADGVAIHNGNRIRHNHGFGVELTGSSVRRVFITQNSITANDSGGIVLRDGANGGIAPPVIGSASSSGNLSGTAPPSCQIEIFGDDGGQGRTYLGTVYSSGAGNWSVEGLVLSAAHYTATATDGSKNTSEFSAPKAPPSAVHAAAAPERFRLLPNHPNPFNPATLISFALPEPSGVTLEILDLRGRRIERRDCGRFEAGFHEIEWEAKDGSR